MRHSATQPSDGCAVKRVARGDLQIRTTGFPSREVRGYTATAREPLPGSDPRKVRLRAEALDTPLPHTDFDPQYQYGEDDGRNFTRWTPMRGA